MTLLEHPGPKGQVLLRGDDRPIWSSSARDAIAFTHLVESPKAVRAIYVSDMRGRNAGTIPARPVGWRRGAPSSFSAAIAAAEWARRRRCPSPTAPRPSGSPRATADGS
jgi:hypothetical protein